MTQAKPSGPDYGARLRRVEKLAARFSFARQILEFYQCIAAFQQELYTKIPEQWGGQGVIDPDKPLRSVLNLVVLLPHFPGFLSLVEHDAPLPLAAAAQALASTGAAAWMAFTLTMASYMGVEVVAVTAGEACRPAEAIPRAMRTMVFRLILFYVLAIAVMVTMIPWNRTGDGSISGSPFVRAFASIGIRNAAFIMNLVVITAALSSSNANLYLSTRMLFSLARGNFAPALLGRLSANGVPHRALAASSLGMVVAIFLAIYVPKRAFLLMYGSAVTGMYFVWRRMR